MPNKHGFNELPIRGSFVRRCIYCSFEAASGKHGESVMRRHARSHRVDVERAAASSRRELAVAAEATL